ncbi:MAG: tetratricopeptide repeat protein [Gemmatimonadales bacterium]
MFAGSAHLRYVFGLVAMGTAFVAADLQGQEPVHIEGLGSLYFPTSGNVEAQDDFLRGVLLMHSFEYDRAADAFRKAQEIDPGFAMAYWGEAMTHTHPVPAPGTHSGSTAGEGADRARERLPGSRRGAVR